MGGAFSTCQDNDELVDTLVQGGYIRSKKIEQVFRAVDRGDYFLSSHKENAYKDFAWKHGNIHLSAPCIYCEVLEELDLRPGLSFLNLGSGTGYLSTMAGLMLSQKGVNHGIELHEDCVSYSYDRLEEFKQKSLALDEFDFCEPVFVQGNCLNVAYNKCYDRVYCGATCPETHVAIIKEFVKVGGLLIMPYEDKLVRATRVEENKWEEYTILPVSFANLVIPPKSDKVCDLPVCEPLSLQELCRGKIRRRLRQNVWFEHSGTLETRKPINFERNNRSPSHRALRQWVIPIFEDSDENSSDDEAGNRETREHTPGQYLFNIGPPGENLRTTLQYVRAIVRPTRNRDTPNEPDHEYAEALSNLERRWNDGDDSTSTEEDVQLNTNASSERERQDSESLTSSDSACDKSQSESNNSEVVNVESKESDKKPQATGVLSAYSNMSESESDEDEPKDNDNSDSQRTKLTNINVDDSGIADDTGNEDSETNSNSETPKKRNKSTFRALPIKNKRSSSTAPPNEPSRKRNTCENFQYNDKDTNVHYVDTNAFSVYMKEKIHQLPLPYSLKLYINYNRTNF